MRMTKKITSLVLAVMLVASMLVVGAVSASAATLSDLQTLVNAGGTVTLDQDYTYSGRLYINNGVTVTLDLNGHTLKSTDDCAISANGGNLTITGNGFVEAQEMCVIAFSGSTVTIENGTFTAYDNAVLGTNGTTGYGGNTFNINGGTFIGRIESAGYSACGIYAPNDDVWNVNGGTFNITGGAGIVQRAGTVNVNGGTFNVTGTGTGKVGDSNVVIPNGAGVVFDSKANYPLRSDDDSASVSGGSFDTTSGSVAFVNQVGDENKRIEVSGGEFTQAPADEFLAADVKVAEKDGTKYVVDKSSQGVITTEAELKAAAAAGGNWVLGNDINITDDAFTDVIYESGNTDTVKRVAVDNDFVLNGAGYTLKVAADVDTIFGLNNATADITLSNVKIDGDHKAAWAVCSYTANGGNNSGNTINLNNVEICNFDSVSDAGAVCVFGSATANLTECNIHDNTASGTEYEGTSVWGGAASKINVNGGSYEGLYINGGTGAITVDGNADVDIIRVGTDNAGNYRVTIGTATVGEIAPDGDAVVPEGAIQVSPSASYDTDNYEVVNGYLVSKPTVAKTGGKNYGSLKSAVESAAAGATVTVTADNAVNDVIYITKDVTINATNKTIDGAVFYYKTNTAKLTLNGGIYDGKGVDDNFIWTCAVAQPDGSAADGTYRNANAGTIVTMIGTTVENYDGYLYTGAVYLFSHATGNFTHCTFRNNSTPDVDEDGFRGSDIWGGAATTINIHGGSFGDVVFVNGGSAKLTADNYAQIHQVDLFAVKGEANKFITANNATITTLNALNTKIDGYQKKTVKSGESTVAEGNDINTKGVRIIVQADKDFLDTCSDYGFVVAKYTGNKAQADLDFSVLNTTSGNGQKVISCKDSVNSGLGLDENYVTLAVNNMSAGNKVVVRFYYVKDNVTHYSTYSSYDGILATF